MHALASGARAGGPYEVVTNLGSGRQLKLTTRRPRARIPAVPRTLSGRVAVRGVAELSAGGRGVVRFRSLARPRTRVLPLPKPPRLRR